MSALVSAVKLIYQLVREILATYAVLQKRISDDPGLPVPNPTRSYWTVPISEVNASGADLSLPDHADIIIVGSGITGASIAYHILGLEPQTKIVMLDARDVCSGATSRNGGHVNPVLYEEYKSFKEEHGLLATKRMFAFRQAHLPELLAVAKREDILEKSQCRRTEHLNVYTDINSFEQARADLSNWKAEMPDESAAHILHERAEAIEKFRLGPDTVGCISAPGGAMHPYAFVTAILSKLLSRHPDSFRLFPNTPCTAITAPTPSFPAYTVHTPRGTLTAPHVIHATNGWASHLLPALRAKLVPVRAAMSAQRPGAALAASTRAGARSHVFHRADGGFDYLTQLPSPGGELMFGGAFSLARLPELGRADDGATHALAQAHLAGALPNLFGLENWGAEARPEPARPGEPWGRGRTKAQWSGILGASADLRPWVGRLPQRVAGRAAPPPAAVGEKMRVRSAPPGEWICAGFTGEGMVHAWLSGKALAHMVLDREGEIGGWFPETMRVTEERWRKADFGKLVEKYK